MLDDSWRGGPIRATGYVLPFGRAKKVRQGDRITIVTWARWLPRCEEAAEGRLGRRDRSEDSDAVGSRDGAGERSPHPPLPDRP
jgi:hypothetical protein